MGYELRQVYAWTRYHEGRNEERNSKFAAQRVTTSILQIQLLRVSGYSLFRVLYFVNRRSARKVEARPSPAPPAKQDRQTGPTTCST